MLRNTVFKNVFTSLNIAPFSRSQYLLERIASDIFSHFPPAEINAIKEELQKSANPAV